MSDPPDLSADKELMEKIRREGSRWEAILMETFFNIEAYSDSLAKVLQWLPNCDEYSSVESGINSIISSPEDPEPRDET
ncbi:GTPase IMAP family member 8-like protein [Labeo rohita]|uniref:GTPase IMAP family member 8-like protein n=1 Tax=Labeo rohita TaxID=84645 RepID=A0A498P0J6_LABRO|nr:GTPase IMAP family member 8-like protein [Labeo rohita]